MNRLLVTLKEDSVFSPRDFVLFSILAR